MNCVPQATCIYSEENHPGVHAQLSWPLAIRTGYSDLSGYLRAAPTPKLSSHRNLRRFIGIVAKLYRRHLLGYFDMVSF